MEGYLNNIELIKAGFDIQFNNFCYDLVRHGKIIVKDFKKNDFFGIEYLKNGMYSVAKYIEEKDFMERIVFDLNGSIVIDGLDYHDDRYPGQEDFMKVGEPSKNGSYVIRKSYKNYDNYYDMYSIINKEGDIIIPFNRLKSDGFNGERYSIFYLDEYRYNSLYTEPFTYTINTKGEYINFR